MADWPLAAPKYIRLDLFPAKVEGIEQTARVIVTDAHFYFFVDAPGGGTPVAEVSGALYDIEGRNTIGYILVEDGDPDVTWNFRRATGCGCGSRLRGFRPFPGVPINSAF